MEAKVNKLPQQATLTLVAKDTESELLKSIADTRYQLMARIVTRVLLKKE